ncbi:homeobox-leucine zipper protein HAT5-like [Impatiens glandulifera]|uniref:homeobox-leucine zipper protein HAT5-like n=1 Tax=Impatiens glandulifera TaxID=253017 RepID=UPI001FB08A69|nr:homeobox-leucine zipper protein HAT5-like [Impatiens glandulifera]
MAAHPLDLDSSFNFGSSSFRGANSILSFDDAKGITNKPFFFSFDQEDNIVDDDLDGYNFHKHEKKRRLTNDQVQFLEKNFETENKLEPDRKLQLAKDLGLQPRQVAIWFQNRRARWKTKQMEKDYDGLEADYKELKVNYDSLLKEKSKLESEVMKLKEELLKKKMNDPESPEHDTPSRIQNVEPIPNWEEEKEVGKISMKDGFIDSDSPQSIDQGYYSWHIPETHHSDSSIDEEENLSTSMLSPLLLPFEDSTCEFGGFQDEDQIFGF